MKGLNKRKFTASDGATVYLLGILCIFLISNALGFVFGGIDGSERPALYEAVNMLANALLQVGLIAVYVIYIKTSGARPQIGLNKSAPLSYLFGVLAAIVALYGFVLPAELFDEQLRRIGFTSDAFAVSTLPGKISLVLLTVLIAPIGEELIFRSALISGLSRRLSAVPCILINGLTFSLMHMNPAQTVYQLALGCALAALALASRSVIPCIVCHSTSNLMACLTELVPGFTKKFFAPVLFVGGDGRNALWIVFLMLAAVGVTSAGYIFLRRLTVKNSDFTEEKATEPAFFDPVTLAPVFEGDPDYEQRLKRKNAQGSSAEAEAVQALLRRQYDAKNGERGGFLGKNTFFKCICIGIGFCAIMWLLALFVSV